MASHTGSSSTVAAAELNLGAMDFDNLPFHWDGQGYTLWLLSFVFVVVFAL